MSAYTVCDLFVQLAIYSQSLRAIRIAGYTIWLYIYNS